MSSIVAKIYCECLCKCDYNLIHNSCLIKFIRATKKRRVRLYALFDDASLHRNY